MGSSSVLDGQITRCHANFQRGVTSFTLSASVRSYLIVCATYTSPKVDLEADKTH